MFKKALVLFISVGLSSHSFAGKDSSKKKIQIRQKNPLHSYSHLGRTAPLYTFTPEEMEALEIYKSLDLQTRQTRSIELEQFLDGLALSYREGQIGDREVFEKIFSESEKFKSLGFLLELIEPKWIITGLPTEETRAKWIDGSAGVVAPFTREPVDMHGKSVDFSHPGWLFFELPKLKNGHGLYDPENKLIAHATTLFLFELSYIVVQTARCDDKKVNANISQYLLSRPELVQEIRQKVKSAAGEGMEWDMITSKDATSSVDVYAKLLEVLGPDLVPNWLEGIVAINEYEEKRHDIRFNLRSRIDRDAIVVSGIPCPSALIKGS